MVSIRVVRAWEESSPLFGDLSPQQVTYLVIMVVAFGLLITEWLRNDIVAILIVLALALTRLLSP